MNDIFDSFDISTKTQLEVDTEVTGSRLLGKSHYLRHHYPCFPSGKVGQFKELS